MGQYAFLMQIKDGCKEEYVRRHQAVWPRVLEGCIKAGIRNYAIFANGNQLFACLECDDFREASMRMAAMPEIAEWEEYMAPIMAASRVDTGAEGLGTNMLQQVFQLERATNNREAAET